MALLIKFEKTCISLFLSVIMNAFFSFLSQMRFTQLEHLNLKTSMISLHMEFKSVGLICIVNSPDSTLDKSSISVTKSIKRLFLLYIISRDFALNKDVSLLAIMREKTSRAVRGVLVA